MTGIISHGTESARRLLRVINSRPVLNPADIKPSAPMLHVELVNTKHMTDGRCVIAMGLQQR